jgi:hypothetical protein
VNASQTSRVTPPPGSTSERRLESELPQACEIGGRLSRQARAALAGDEAVLKGGRSPYACAARQYPRGVRFPTEIADLTIFMTDLGGIRPTHFGVNFTMLPA